MATRTGSQRTRQGITEAETAELASHYARILGQPADHRVSAVIRICLRRLPSRLPVSGRDRRAVEGLIERVLRLGEVGSPDLVGSTREIDGSIARRLGEPAGDPRSVYRALHAMLGRTALVERHSRQTWALRLSGLADSGSEVHRALVAETPTLYCLPTPEADRAEAAVDHAIDPHQVTPSAADPSSGPRADLVRVQDELAAERLARVEADRQRHSADAELERLHRVLDEERQDQARAIRDQRAKADALQVEVHRLERELDAVRVREQGLADSLANAQRIVEGARTAQAADAAHLRQLIEENRPHEAAAFFAARMFGLNYDDAGPALLALVQQTAAGVVEPTPSSPSQVNPVSAGGPSAAVVGDPSPPSREPPPVAPHDSALVAPASADSRTPKPPSPGSSRKERLLWSPTSALAADRTERDEARPRPYLAPSKAGRNALCPCGSGKKFKRCCGQSTS